MECMYVFRGKVCHLLVRQMCTLGLAAATTADTRVLLW